MQRSGWGPVPTPSGELEGDEDWSTLRLESIPFVVAHPSRMTGDVAVSVLQCCVYYFFVLHGIFGML